LINIEEKISSNTNSNKIKNISEKKLGQIDKVEITNTNLKYEKFSIDEDSSIKFSKRQIDMFCSPSKGFKTSSNSNNKKNDFKLDNFDKISDVTDNISPVTNKDFPSPIKPGFFKRIKNRTKSMALGVLDIGIASIDGIKRLFGK